jgi:chorismate mutase
MTEVDVLRERILQIDEQILKLWKERNDAARRIGALKQSAGLPLQNFEVEKTVLDHAERSARPLGLLPEPVRALMRILIESSLALQEKERAQAQSGRGRTALVVGGAGRMGFWFVRFLEGQGYQVHIDDPAASFQPAPPADLKPDVVIIATPPSTITEVLDKYAAKLGKDTLLVDIASIKGEAAGRLRRCGAWRSTDTRWRAFTRCSVPASTSSWGATYCCSTAAANPVWTRRRPSSRTRRPRRRRCRSRCMIPSWPKCSASAMRPASSSTTR